ncbi:MAG: polyprenyl synthetase family protein [Candidatus Moraniibacteriota bacterium]
MDKKELVKQKLEFWKGQINRALAAYWERKNCPGIYCNRAIADSWRNIGKIVKSGGKRLRPALMLMIYELSGKKDAKKIMPAALSLELLHSYFLVHDDIIDEDGLRHGATTLNEIYRTDSKKFGKGVIDSIHFGESIAMLLGDRLAAEAFQIVLESKLEAKVKNQITTELLEMAQITICGQMLDVMVSFPVNGGFTKPKRAVKEIIRNKTAHYSFVAPIRIGGILGDIKKKDIKIMEEIGYKLGEIFQWQDDYLGIFADEKILGKPAGSDLREKKPTFLLLKTYEKLAIQDRIRLRNLMGRNLSPAELEKARKLIKKSGADKWMSDKINDSLRKLIEFIQSSELSMAGKNVFIGLTNLLIGRRY